LKLVKTATYFNSWFIFSGRARLQRRRKKFFGH
jgi:hypothetical protein